MSDESKCSKCGKSYPEFTTNRDYCHCTRIKKSDEKKWRELSNAELIQIVKGRWPGAPYPCSDYFIRGYRMNVAAMEELRAELKEARAIKRALSDKARAHDDGALAYSALNAELTELRGKLELATMATWNTEREEELKSQLTALRAQHAGEVKDLVDALESTLDEIIGLLQCCDMPLSLTTEKIEAALEKHRTEATR